MIRQYDSSRRKQTAMQTREKILQAAMKLHWQGITEYAPLAQAYPSNQGASSPYAMGAEPATYAEEPAAVSAYDASPVEFLGPTRTEAE